MQNKKPFEKISCLNTKPGYCDFCDARCPDWVDENLIKEFILTNTDFLHKISLERLEAAHNGERDSN